MKKFIISMALLTMVLQLPVDLIAQNVDIGAEVRPRFEYRNGYMQLMPDGKTPASFISQRTRLNAYYANENFKVKLVLQDVRVWGDVNQLNKGDVYGTSIHEAWGEILFSEKFSIKFGRQEIVYDDHRIFGSVGWAQQARSHDAAIFKFLPNKNHKIDLGVAYNATGETLYAADYTGMKNYKALQFIHYHGNFNKFGLSVLELYNGMAYDADTSANLEEKISWSLTIGPRLSYSGDKVKANVAFYYQGGKNAGNNDLVAMYLGGDIAFNMVKDFTFGVGFEYLSGTATKDKGTGKDKSFTPFYGTNHKFNGWMDYFYVGNHGGNVGITDIYLPIVYKFKKWTFKAIPHYFMSAATVSKEDGAGLWTDYSNGLGTEVDLVAIYSMSQAINLQAGYSQMFATETMQIIKGGNYQNTNNWAWIMITFKPTFFKK